jgi:hypothetical protein
MFSQDLRGNFGLDCVDKAIGSPFESCDFAKSRNHPQSPMMCFVIELMKRAGLQDVFVGGLRLCSLECRETRFENCCKVQEFRSGSVFEVRSMPSRDNGKGKRETGSKRTDYHEMLGLHNDSVALSNLFVHYLANITAPILFVMLDQPLMYPLNIAWNKIETDNLTMGMRERGTSVRSKVLKDDSKLDVGVRTPVKQSFPVGFQNKLYVLRGHGSKTGDMIR